MPDYRLKPIDIRRQQPRVATDSGKMTEEADRKQASSAPALEPPVTCIDTGENMEFTVKNRCRLHIISDNSLL